MEPGQSPVAAHPSAPRLERARHRDFRDDLPGLPVEDDALLVAHDFGEVARFDDEVVSWTGLDRSAIRRRVADAARDDVLPMVQGTLVERHVRPDIPLPAPAWTQARHPDGGLARKAEPSLPERDPRRVAQLPVIGHLVSLADVLSLDASHRSQPSTSCPRGSGRRGLLRSGRGGCRWKRTR